MKNALTFEGTEKKVEIVFSPAIKSVRLKGPKFWNKICQRAGTRILSRFSSSFCDSYILSESSLFVWDHRLLMLTCGSTSLTSAITALLKNFKEEDILLLFYQRKNEFFPYNQKSSFMDDFQKINKKLNGKSYRFGQPDEHHFYLFHSNHQSYYPAAPDRTLEILMYDADDFIKNLFSTAGSAEEIKHTLQLDKIFKNSQVDDYMFQPAGYSLNGLLGENEYYTIHATVQDPGFYISFETNAQDYSAEWIIDKTLSLFRPFAFDVIAFSSPEQNIQKIKNYSPSSFTRFSHFEKKLECGYSCLFTGWFKPFKEIRPAFELKL